jgi:uncharacterized protein with PIN domain
MNYQDRFMDKLRLRERAEEDLFFSRRDRQLLDRLHELAEDEQRRRIAEVARMRCPECGARLGRVQHYGVAIEECPQGHGMWMNETEMRTVANRERYSWLGRYFYRPRR